LKLIYVVIDGMGDLPIKELENKTPSKQQRRQTWTSSLRRERQA